MNKKKFKKILNNVVKNNSASAFFVDRLFKEEKKALFNNERIEVLIEKNFPAIFKAVSGGNVDIFINALYSHESMIPFIEKEETIKYILDTVEHYDFDAIINDSDIKEKAREFIKDNIDYVLSNYNMKKVVRIYDSMNLDDDMKAKMEKYFKDKKKTFLSEILTKTLSFNMNKIDDSKMDELLTTVEGIVDKVLQKENCKITDVKILMSGRYSNVLSIGDYVIKVGIPRRTFNMPNHERILQPYLRREFSDDNGIGATIEVCDRVDTDVSISEEEMYQFYKEMRDKGIVCGDLKYDNVGKLIKSNPPRNNPNNGMIGNVSETLQVGEYVLIDTDFVFREDDPDIHMSSDLSQKFESRYKSQKINKGR